MNKLSKLRKSDDLFENSSMTFGEHLEELRKAIAKALVWVGVGLVFGFFLANAIVRYIQTPLEQSLSVHMQNQEIRALEGKLGEPLSDEMKKWIQQNERVSEKVFVDVDELVGIGLAPNVAETKTELNTEPAGEAKLAKDTTTGAQLGKSAPIPGKLVPMTLWRSIKTNTEALSLQEPFMIWMKAAIIAGFVLGSPGVFWHLWGFIAAGLYPHERRYVYFFLPFSVGLFLSGAALAFFVVFHFVIVFLLKFNESMGIGTTPRLTEYVSFALMLPLGFGIAFQLPLAMFVIERLGIVDIKWYLSNWRIAVAVITVISMILTPAEVISMLGMMIPLIGLYFLGIALCKWVPRGRGFGARGYDPA